MDDAIIFEEGYQQCFDHKYLQTTLFLSREVGEHHAIDSRFDSALNW